jgi:hypothetical protein
MKKIYFVKSKFSFVNDFFSKNPTGVLRQTYIIILYTDKIEYLKNITPAGRNRYLCITINFCVLI